TTSLGYPPSRLRPAFATRPRLRWAAVADESPGHAVPSLPPLNGARRAAGEPIVETSESKDIDIPDAWCSVPAQARNTSDGRSELGLDHAQQSALRPRADDRLDWFTGLEEGQRRHRAHVVPRHGRRVGVDIELDHL